jgi:membrane protease YdiL (CAAX protease family)
LIFGILLGWLLFFTLASEFNLLAQQVLATVTITASVFAARRYLDHRSFTSLGFQWTSRAPVDILAGFLISALLMGLIFLIEWSAGWLNINNFAWQVQQAGLPMLGSILLALIFFILVGWTEELFSRGYQLQNLAEGLNLFWGVLLSSLFFAALHFANPAFTSGINPFIGLIFAGLFLAFGYVRTRQLWLPIGLHIGWNFFEGTIFGFPVSGLNMFHLIDQTVQGPDLITGGLFGPEAGLIILPVLALGAGLIYLYTRRHTPVTETNFMDRSESDSA